MDESQEKPLMTRNEVLQYLSEMRDEHKPLYAKAVEKPFHEIQAIDHIIAAVLKRSNALIHGFLTLQKQGNEFAAMPLIRLQVDNVLRLSAFRKVPNPVALAEHMMAQKSFHTFDKNKDKLRDAELKEDLEPQYTYIKELYDELSGYVHLSFSHMLLIFDDWRQSTLQDDDELTFGAIDELPKWDDDRKYQALLWLGTSTRYLLEEVAAVQDIQGKQIA